MILPQLRAYKVNQLHTFANIYFHPPGLFDCLGLIELNFIWSTTRFESITSCVEQNANISILRILNEKWAADADRWSKGVRIVRWIELVIDGLKTKGTKKDLSFVKKLNWETNDEKGFSKFRLCFSHVSIKRRTAAFCCIKRFRRVRLDACF